MTQQAASRPVTSAPDAVDSIDNKALVVVIELERQARSATTTDELAFTIVNQTHRLLPYFQCLLWRRTATGAITVQLVSGVSEIDHHAPFLLLCRRVVCFLAGRKNRTQTYRFQPDRLSPKLASEWTEWLPEHALWGPFNGADGEPAAGLLLTRERPFDDRELGLLEPLIDAYGHAWSALTGGAGQRRRFRHLLRSRLARLTVVAAALALLALPVSESVLAPAEIVPQDPQLVTAPLRGVVKQVHVEPNAAVEPGQLLLTLDDTEIKTQVAVAEKNLEVAEANYLRTVQKSFSDHEAKSDLELFKARVAEKQLEHDHAQTLLARTLVRATTGGVAVFGDANDWIGRPVEVGERIMTLAEPSRVELQIWLPLEDSINLETGAQVRLFLNSDPMRPVNATVSQTSYEPQTNAAGMLAFRLKASLDPAQPPPRVGLKGTAKVFGGEVSLLYYLMRRPLSTLRQSWGW